MIDRRKIGHYLIQPCNPWHWRWDAAGEVIVWPNDRTIAFREEVRAVLQQLAPRGLPPFDCIVLLLAACRNDWESLPQFLPRMQFRSGDGRLATIVDRLRVVTELPAPLRTRLEAKTVLAEIVFEDTTPWIGPDEAAMVLEELDTFEPGETIRRDVTLSRQEILDVRLKSLFAGIERITTESLELRIETGLDRLVVSAKLTIPPSVRVRQLLSELHDDAQFQGLSRLTLDLMAAISLPRAVTDLEDLPMGGVSDITNRGQLDRLLLSELAQDDLTLASRIALHEALYLRRESPPRRHPAQRVLLLDSGIRMWGIPRVFATAVGLALVGTSPKNTEVTVFRAHGDGIAPVNLFLREGLVEHLGILLPAAHPGPALKPFCDTLRQRGVHVDGVLVTSRDVLEDLDFQAALQATQPERLYIASVTREGDFRLELYGEHQRREISAAQLRLADLLAPRAEPTVPLVQPSSKCELPTALTMHTCPLRVPYGVSAPSKAKALWSPARNRILVLTHDRRLLCYTESQHFSVQLGDDLPRGQVYWISPDAVDGISRFVAGSLAPPQLSLVSVNTRWMIYHVTQLVTPARQHHPIDRVCAHNGAIFLVFDDTIEVFGYDGQFVQAFHRQPYIRSVPGLVHAMTSSRFFRTKSGDWYALSFDGQKAHLEGVHCGDGQSLPPLEHLFDWHGHDGPMGVNTSGELFCTAVSQWLRDPLGLAKGVGPIQIAAVAHDGSVLAAVPDPRSQHAPMFICPDPGKINPHLRATTWDRHELPQVAVHRLTLPFPVAQPTSPLRHDFHAVAISRKSNLALASRRAFWELSLECGVFRLRSTDHVHHAVVFERVPVQQRGCVRFRRAQVSKHQAVFLDSRGFLHLIHLDLERPNATLALSFDGCVAGSCSDGRYFGDLRFHTLTTRELTPGETIQLEVIRPFIQRWVDDKSASSSSS